MMRYLIVILILFVCIQSFALNPNLGSDGADSLNFDADVIEGEKPPFREDVIEGSAKRSALFLDEANDETSFETVLLRRLDFNDFVDYEKSRGRLKPQ